jgi:thiamine biosynthesis lipoprotein
MPDTAVIRQMECRAMNTTIELTVEAENGDDKRAIALEESVRRWFFSTEQRFSRFLPGSELSRLNQNSGKLTLVSAAMADVLSLAEMYRQQTRGIFDYFVGEALQHAGYSCSFERLRYRIAVTAPPPDKRCHEMVLDVGMKSVSLSEGAAIDLGGIVKGWAVERMVSRLKRRHRIPRGVLNAGGDLQVWGGFQKDEPWLIGIADPWNEEGELAQYAAFDGAVATSSVLGRRWRTDCGEMHHLVDPRTMRPAQSDVVQCTVIGSSVVECEIWAKVVCILGSKEGVPLLKAHLPHAEALFVTGTGEVHYVGGKSVDRERWPAVWIDVAHIGR